MLDLGFGPYTHLLAKYQPLLLKMDLDNSLIQQGCEDFDMLINIETLLALVCIMPLLESILIMFAQSKFIFIICDYVVVVKVCQNNLYFMYLDELSKIAYLWIEWYIFPFLRNFLNKKNYHCTIDFLACPCELEVYPIWMGITHSDVVKDGNDEHY